MLKIDLRSFIYYKLVNSLLFGLSMGVVFIVYTPLEPSVYSLGGIALALGTIYLAKLYNKIMTLEWFYKISLFVELLALGLICYFLLFSYSYITAITIYFGYQLIFTFGTYLIRAETIFVSRRALLSLLDLAKQKGYLVGMFISYIFYKILEVFFDIHTKEEQVYLIYYLFFALELLIIFYLLKAFRRKV